MGMTAELERDFTAFVEARGAALFRCAMALTGHRQQAEDLLQTVLARAFRHWRKVSQGQPEAYLRRAMYRQQASFWRRGLHRREVVSAEVPERAAGPDGTAGVDLTLTLRRALDRLAPKYRAVLVLRYFEDLPDAEIAQVLGCAESTVRSQAHRALARLRALCPDLLPSGSPDHLALSVPTTAREARR
jgi:RNA polymerase sigma-70 factor (sigma-E family)